MCAETVKTEFSEPETTRTDAASAQLTCAVLVRNGVRDLPGWLAWHLALGVQEIVVIDAGSTDGTQELVAALGEDWPIRLLSFTVPTSVQAPDDCRIALTQAAMQTLAESVPPSKNSALHWGLVLDVDEYLAPATDLPTLLSAADPHSVFPLHWRQFGTSGHTTTQFGHVVATHVQGASVSHPAHDFCRHMVRLKDLIPENVLDLTTTATLGTAPYSPSPLSSPDTHAGWEAGCLLHYPLRSETEAAQYPVALQAYFNQNDQTDWVGQRFLPVTRTLQNQLLETLWDEAHTQLRALATQQEREDQWAAAQEEEAFNMPETIQLDGFTCRRLHPGWQARQLLTPEAAPPYAPVQSFLLRQADGTIVKAECGTPLVGLRDFRTPSLLALTLPGQELFAFGDVPIVQGWGVIRLSPDMESAAQAGIFFFPPQQQPLHNTPLENPRHSAPPLRMVPDESISLPDLVPLPETGAHKALSMPGFLRWVATHPWAQALDIRRALLLLGPEEAENLARSVPTIRPFLLQIQGQP